MSYEERTYRSIHNPGRFIYQEVIYKETDLWIGTGPSIDKVQVENVSKQQIISLREELESYIAAYPDFQSALLPLDIKDDQPGSVRDLILASSYAGTGPMAGVAGLFAERVGQKLMKLDPLSEVLLENGGDIFTSVTNSITIAVYAGKSPLSEKIGITLQAGIWGICTSSGTVGHSTSFGIADALVIVSHNTVLADCYATMFANKIKSASDIEAVLKETESIPQIEGILIIADEVIGARGNFTIERI